MKFKLKPVIRRERSKIIIGAELVDAEDRADMYLPVGVLVFGGFLILLGLLFGAVFILAMQPFLLIMTAVIWVLAGIAMIMCWKNQTIFVLSDEVFEYKTIIGNKKAYRFDEIKEIKKGIGGLTLIVSDSKIDIDSNAIISSRLSEKINEQMERLYGKKFVLEEYGFACAKKESDT